MSTVTNVTDRDFEHTVLQAEIPVLVDFWAPWCGPCLQVAPILEQIAADHSDRLRIVKLNVDENPATAASYRITGMPTMHVFHGGQVVQTIRGAKPRMAILSDLAEFIG